MNLTRKGLQDKGRPLPQETWDRQYREGAWESLDSLDELAHYMVIAGYVHHLLNPDYSRSPGAPSPGTPWVPSPIEGEEHTARSPLPTAGEGQGEGAAPRRKATSRIIRVKSPTILDVGCGHGRLMDVLKGFPFQHYLGIDLSAEAIRRARSRAGKHTRFCLADLNIWNPPGRFSVIIFCESLNYAIHPVSALLGYSRALERDGAIIVSLYRHPNHGRIWRNADRDFQTVDSTAVTNHKGRTWDIRVLRPKPNAPRRRTPDGEPHDLVRGCRRNSVIE